MPMIDIYATIGTFADTRKLAADAAAVVKGVEKGVIGRGAGIWRPGWDQWRAAGNVPEETSHDFPRTRLRERVREANLLEGWIEVEDGVIVGAGYRVTSAKRFVHVVVGNRPAEAAATHLNKFQVPS